MLSPKLIIIIVSYNGEKWIFECIRSIIKNRFDHYQVVVVDNASQDGTVEIIKKKFRKVVLLNQKKNIGFGKGANVGIQYAISQKADYIMLLNQDIKLEETCIENMIAVCKQNREIGIASPLQMNYDGSAIDSHFKRLYNLKSEQPEENAELLQNSIEVETIIGASMLFRRAVIEAIGTFDPLYFLYHEESDLCRRARYHGIQIHIIPKARVLHKHMQLSPNDMTIKAKISATYGYYFYILKNPFRSFFHNIREMLKQMQEWARRDGHWSKIFARSLINGVAAGIILIHLHRIIKNRKSDMMLKKLLHE